MKNLENRMIHLTNEAVQKRGDDFGKYENGNKLSYADFQKYIEAVYPKDNLNFMASIYPEMKVSARESVGLVIVIPPAHSDLRMTRCAPSSRRSIGRRGTSPLRLEGGGRCFLS